MYPFLFSAVSTPGVYYAYANSDAMGKAIVWLLLVGSVITWTVMIDKFISVYRAQKLSESFMARFRCLRGVPLTCGDGDDPSPVNQVYLAGIAKYREFVDANPDAHGVTDAQLNAIEAVLERETSSQVMGLETRIGLLATLVSVSPFLGLFGTVWGVMLAFCGIAVAGRPDFAALAPGVSGALLTTVCGMLVAIPSLVGYNMLTAAIRKVTVYMDNFSEELVVRIKLDNLSCREKESSAPGPQTFTPAPSPSSSPCFSVNQITLK
ncbi:MAG: MotA/TolQ/ExbB proton channel family protein [Victivallaceae bacterium]|nr:MotA/TolQ/ExbB proton channel family protein [Victivallaceae bacterium]